MRSSSSLSTLLLALAPALSALAGPLHRGDIIIGDFFSNGRLLKVNPTTGAMTKLPTPQYDFHPLFRVDSQNQIVMLDNQEHLVRVNPATGDVTALSETTFTSADGLAIAPDGLIWLTADSGVYKIDPVAHTTTLLPHGGFFSPSGIAVTPGNDVYIDEFFNHLQKVDPVTGATTKLNVTLSFQDGMIADAVGNLVFLVSNHAARVDPLTSIQTILPGTYSAHGIAVEPGGTYVIATSTGIMRINPSTGVATNITPVVPDFFGPNGIAVATVPEPGTLFLAAIGAALICAGYQPNRRLFSRGKSIAM